MVGTYWLRKDDKVFQIIEWYVPYDGTPVFGHARNLATGYKKHYACFTPYGQILTIGGKKCTPIDPNELPFYLLSVE
jgi:hypothetical protein